MSNTRAGPLDTYNDAEAFTVVSPPPFDVTWLLEAESSCWFVEHGGDADGFFTDSSARANQPSDEDSTGAESAATAAQESRKSSSSSSNESYSSSPERTKKLRASALAASGRRRAYVRRKKGELADLRAASDELSAKLEALIAKNDALKSQVMRSGRGGHMMAGWRGVAFRQLQRRIGAERVNRELRIQLRQRNDVAQQLARSFQSHLSLIDAKRLSGVLATPLEKEALRFTDSDMCTIFSLANDLGALHSQANAVLRDCKAPAPPENQLFSSAQAWRWDPDAGGDYLELAETRVVPFEFDAAVRAQPRMLQMMLSEECEPAILRLPGGADAVKFSYNCVDAESRPTRFQCIFVGRMTIEDDRAVMCWRSLSQEQGRVGLASDRYGETGWGVARRRASTSFDGEQQTGTSFSYCTRYRMDTSSESKRDAGLERFGELMALSVEEETISWYQTMEKVVMDDFTTGRGGDLRQRRGSAESREV